MQIVDNGELLMKVVRKGGGGGVHVLYRATGKGILWPIFVGQIGGEVRFVYFMVFHGISSLSLRYYEEHRVSWRKKRDRGREKKKIQIQHED